MFLNIIKFQIMKVNLITRTKDDFLLERELFDFVDNLENFQSRHKKKKEYIDKKPNLFDLYTLDHAKLVLIAYRRNKDKKYIGNLKQYFKKLNQYDKEMLLLEIGVKKSKILEYQASLIL